MRIGRDPSIGVADEKQIAETAQLVAGVDDDAIIGRAHRRPQGCRDVDPVVVRAAVPGAEGQDDLAVDGPEEFA